MSAENNTTDANPFGERPKTEGHQWLAAFRQPLPMNAAGKLLKACVKAYGGDARVDPSGDWIRISGHIPAVPPIPGITETLGTGPTELLEGIQPILVFRVCELPMVDPEDGMRVEATCPLDAAALACKRHTGLMEFERLHVLPDDDGPEVTIRKADIQRVLNLWGQMGKPEAYEKPPTA